jgi:hypothetical protein
MFVSQKCESLERTYLITPNIQVISHTCLLGVFTL